MYACHMDVGCATHHFTFKILLALERPIRLAASYEAGLIYCICYVFGDCDDAATPTSGTSTPAMSPTSNATNTLDTRL